MYPKSMQKLIESLRILPGVGEKTAERYALYLLEQDPERLEILSESIIQAKLSLKECEICHNLSDEAICDICADDQRDKTTICVVSNVKEAFSIEKTGAFQGTYHVLGGLISSKKGILPDDLNIKSLYTRIDEEVDELILALNATVEGEMTALYLSKKLKGKVKVSRLAFGLPIGGHLDYADDLTLLKAFEGRNKME